MFCESKKYYIGFEIFWKRSRNMGYREIIEEDDFNRITEQNIKFLDEISQKMKQGDISIFAGAGLSIASGYVDWKKLLEPISKQLRLNPNIDLTEIAQYYEDKFGRQGLNSLVFNEFDKIPKNNENINWLSKMPISEYWTTNYDHVIEQAIKKQGKSYQKLVKKEDFKYHKIGREVAIYKMHGDKDSPDDVVLTKEDYQNYDIDRGIFTRMLSVELIRKSFVFIGFSFNDPNLERILSIAKQTLQGKAPQTHYCFMRKVQLIDYLNEHNRLEIQNIEKYIRDNNYQILRCNSMVKYGIQTILINDYDEITLMLKHLYNKYITNNVFISGGINPANLSDYGTFKMVNDTNLNLNSAESFFTMLGRDLVDNGFHIYTGFGAGVGNYVLAGVLQSNKNRLNGEVINDDIHISSMMSVMDLEKKNRIRRKMIEQCSSSIIVFGYGKKDSGTYQEYHIAKDDNKYIIPVKKTGFAAKEIYNGLPKKEKQELLFLEKENEISVVIKEIVNLLILHKKRTEIELKEKIYSGIALSGIKVFISYHYESDNAIAKEIADIVNSEKTNIFTVIEEQKKSNNSKEIKKWVDEEILKTKFTILLISKDTFQREYVSYEIKKSKENRNTFIPILIDNEKNIGLEQKTNQVKELLNVINCEPTRFWYRDEGGKNIVRWLNDALHVSEKV